jgi:hypothetical protein
MAKTVGIILGSTDEFIDHVELADLHNWLRIHSLRAEHLARGWIRVWPVG